METYEQIESFTSGEMTGEERRLFEQAMQQDADLRDKVTVYEQLHRHLLRSEQIDAGATALKNTIQTAIEERKAADNVQAKIIPMRKRMFVGLSAAASIAVLVLVAKFLFFAPGKIDGAALYTEYASFEKLSVTNRGTAADSVLVAAVDFFNQQKYKEAIPALDTYLATMPDQTRYQLARGYALMQLGRFPEAEKDLGKVAAGSSIYTSQAKWYQALSRLKQGDVEGSKKILSDIQAGEDMYEMAQALLKKID